MADRNVGSLRSGLGLILWLGLGFAVALFGAQFTPGPWYEQLVKPPWTPPDGVFAPVWTLLYASMGIAAWLVWKPGGLAGAPAALALFIGQLLLNGAWSWLFFGLHRIGLALADIVLLWLAILATLIAFWRRRRAAGLLLLPYGLWVGFALALNFAIWRLNP